MTNFVYIRQKDGPYCVELGSRWFKDHENEIEITFEKKIPYVHWSNGNLFSSPPDVGNEDRPLIDSLIDQLAKLSDAQLKTRAYLTKPMKDALIAERTGASRLNMPLL